LSISISHWKYRFILLLLVGCAKVRAIENVPNIELGDASFFPTIEALTDATISSGNKIEFLANGDELFPVMLREIKNT